MFRYIIIRTRNYVYRLIICTVILVNKRFAFEDKLKVYYEEVQNQIQHNFPTLIIHTYLYIVFNYNPISNKILYYYKRIRL